MIKINLLGDSLALAAARTGEKPAEQQVDPVYAQVETSRRTSLPVAGAIVGLTLASAGLVYYFWLDHQIQNAEATKTKLEAQKQELDKYTKLYKEYVEKKELLKKKLEVLRGLKGNQELTVKVMEQLANCVPDDIWFNDLLINGRSITVTGSGRSFESVNLFRGKLAENRIWFTKVNHQTSTRDNAQNVSFTITFELAESAS